MFGKVIAKKTKWSRYCGTHCSWCIFNI